MANRKEKTVEITWGKYEYNKAEKEVISLNLANKHLAKERLEDEKKSSSSNFKAKIDMAISEINLLSINLANGYEHRDFKCYKEMDYKKNIKRFIEVETGKLIKEESFGSLDYQLKFDI